MEYWWEVLKVLTFWGLNQVPWSCYCHVQHQLPVLWIMPLSGEAWRGNITAEVLPAVQLALHHLSEQPPPLGNYELQFHLTDSKCDDAKALKAFFDTIFYGPKHLMIFGGVCSSVTSIIAQSLENWNLVQLSFAATAPSLANKKRFPNFFRTVPSDSAVNLALVRLLRQYGWSRVGTLTQREQRFSEIQGDLSRHLQLVNIQLAEAESFSAAPCASVKKLKDNDVRIVIATFDVNLAAKVLCCVYNLRMYGHKYQWILPEWAQAGWWTYTGSSNCTASNVLTAMEGSITADFETLSSKHIRGISGRTPQEYEREYDQKRLLKHLSASKFHGFAYDGIWVIAKVLTRVMETVRYREKYSIHRNFTVTDQDMEHMILEAMDKINFFGVTGHVMFQKGERVANVKFAQYQDGKAVKIGTYSAVTDELEFIRPIRFQGEEPTKDRTHVHPQRKGISTLLYGIMASLSVLGILTACCFLIFHVKNRNHWAIKMTNTSLNSLIIFGAILCYTFIIFLGLDGSWVSDEVFEASCSVRTWLISVGYTAIFGTMFSKTWRIYSIFKNDSVEKGITKDYRLILIVLFLLLVDLGLLIIQQIWDPLKRTVQVYHIEADPHGRDFSIQPFLERCENTYMVFWMVAFYIYKGILLMSTCFLAWTTLHWNTAVPNDNRCLQISVFVAGPVSLIGAYASMLSQDQPNVQFCIVALVIITCCSSSLCMLFVPKIIVIRMDPDPASFSGKFHPTHWHSETEKDSEQKHLEKVVMEQKDSEASAHVTDISQDITATLDILHLDNQGFKLHIIELDSELEDLTRQLNDPSPYYVENFSAVRSVQTAGWRILELHPSAADTDVMDDRVLSVKGKCLTLPESSSCNRRLQEEINSLEHVQRRLSLQLPILHHAYWPSIGGVDSSPLSSPCDKT